MKKLLLLFLLIPLTTSIQAKKLKTTDPAFATTVYIYALSASFNDSVVYITDVQVVDSAYMTNRKFLGGLRDYVTQLDTYFRSKGIEHRTNTVFFKRTRKEAEKAYTKLRKRYTDSGLELKALPTGEFTFKAERPTISEETQVVKEKPVKKRKPQAKKQRRGMPDVNPRS